MFYIESHRIISPGVLAEINALIFDVWSHESATDNDVEVLASSGQASLDPLDTLSHHVIVRNQHKKLVGYGRITVAKLATSSGPRFPNLVWMTRISPVLTSADLLFIQNLGDRESRL